MTIFDRVRSLALPLGSYAVMSGDVFAAHGIRETSDIDLLVTNDLFESLKRNGWVGETGMDGIGTKLRRGDAEAFTDICVGAFQPDTNECIANADILDGIAFMTLADTRAFKLAYGREKDLRDVALIDAYLAN